MWKLYLIVCVPERELLSLREETVPRVDLFTPRDIVLVAYQPGGPPNRRIFVADLADEYYFYVLAPEATYVYKILKEKYAEMKGEKPIKETKK